MKVPRNAADWIWPNMVVELTDGVELHMVCKSIIELIPQEYRNRFRLEYHFDPSATICVIIDHGAWVFHRLSVRDAMSRASDFDKEETDAVAKEEVALLEEQQLIASLPHEPIRYVDPWKPECQYNSGSRPCFKISECPFFHTGDHKCDGCGFTVSKQSVLKEVLEFQLLFRKDPIRDLIVTQFKNHKTNDQSVCDPEIWAVFAEVLKRDRESVECFAFNFGTWESAQFRNPYGEQCHAHAHIVLRPFVRELMGESLRGRIFPPDESCRAMNLKSLKRELAINYVSPSSLSLHV